MSNIPAYQNPCVAPDTSSSNSVFVIGVPSTTEGRLEAYKVNLNNINAPNAVLFGNVSDISWSSTAPKFCTNFPSFGGNSAILVQQFGGQLRTLSTHLHPNGTFEDYPIFFDKVSFESPKLFSLTSAAVGYLSVFDGDGKSGYVFTASSSTVRINTTSPDRVQTLSNRQPIDMGGIVLTRDAYSVTQGSTGYVIDKATSDGTTLLYKISPGSGSAKLTPIAVSNVPPFWPNRAVTSLGSQLVFFGGLQGTSPTSTFHVFDSITSQWGGPGLVQYKPPVKEDPGKGNNNPPPAPEESKSNTGAIIGGVVAAVVVLALVGFFFFRRNKKKSSATEDQATPNTMSHVPPQAQYPDVTKVPPANMAHPPYAVPATPASPQQLPSPQLPPHQVPPHQQVHGGAHPTTYSQYGMTAISTAPGQPGQADPPIFFQPQLQHNAHHSYQPPILTNINQSPPQIFQPASTTTSPVPSNTAYSPNTFSTTTPHSQTTAASNANAGSPQYTKPPTHGYVS
ncbi:hypothetical protein DFQ27_008904 [Actinomortierella ambigua]|uniref:Uncharacterized protein n=1 Tax=Actinomortierella ambigua TaxID=1343610 RepID=A0A9P6PRM4_9FUNG|nr:hypothetical protein DFQ27_008904 [Actinomortierella ambigua]